MTVQFQSAAAGNGIIGDCTPGLDKLPGLAHYNGEGGPGTPVFFPEDGPRSSIPPLFA